MYKSASFCGLIMRLNRRGESLVELVVAMALFAIVVPSLYFALESAMHLNLFSDTDSEATYLAQAELENIDALSPYNTMNDVFVTTLTYSDTCDTGISYCKTVNDVIYEVETSTLNTSALVDSILLHVTHKDVTVSLQLYVNFGE